MEFLYFTKPTNKGTMQTVEMLMDAKDEEERAAIWTAATAFELRDLLIERGGAVYADRIYRAACAFLRDRFGVWHHAMRGLVPEIMIPYSVLRSMEYKKADAVMGLIQTNTMLLRGTYSVLCYSSLKEGEMPEKRGVRADQ